MMRTPIAVAALVLLGACGGSKDNTSNQNSGAMTDTSAGGVNNPSTTTTPSSTTPSATPSPAPTTTPDTSSMRQMRGDTSKMSGRRHHPKKDSSMTH